MKANLIAAGTLVFSLFATFLCLTMARSYPGARRYSCGTPAAMIEGTVEFLMPFAVLTAMAGWRASKPAPVAALLGGGATLMSLAAWLGALAFILFIKYDGG